ncbi:MurR/RpiR family transcriptional regulator [Pseudonocardia eucalypti]|uniref:MurR/RpiR family transcriptional regulator n=2 Tax=Pseudonocardia eucalypti TaxID=648755 RepID=A0ABP9R7P7_9PSEU
MDGFASGQRRIATVLLTDPGGTAFRSIADMAKVADVHQSSLVRFASTLGLKGYPALVALCRDHLAEEAQLVSRFGRAMEQFESGGLLSTAVEHEERNLRRTFTRIDPEQWERTVALLAEADRVYVMGLRKCLPIAQLMAYLLRMVRPGVTQVAPLAGALVDEMRDLRPDDVFVAISIQRYTADTVRVFTEAKRRGLRTVAFTDTAASPLARIADVTFLVDCEGVTILRSVTSFISLVQTLATAVALQRGTRSRDQLFTDERMLSEFSVYAT